MSLISPGLTAIPAIMAMAVIFSRMLALVAHEVRLIIIVRLALQGTQPCERSDILRALTSVLQDQPSSTIRSVDSARPEHRIQ